MTWPVLEALQSSIQLAMLSLLGQTNSLAVFAVACSFRSISTNTKPLGGTYATHFELVVPSPTALMVLGPL